MTGSPFADPEGARRWVEEYEAGQPHAEVEQIGRWTWAVRVVHGIVVWGPGGGPFVVRGGPARAERVAARLLARYEEQERRRARTRRRVVFRE